MKIRNIIKTVAVAGGLLAATQAVAEVRWGVASEPYPPFASKGADGEWIGWEIEIGNALCAAMNEECSWVEVSWDGIIPALQSKKFDAIVASMSITEDRMKVISFSNKYYQTPAVVVAPKSSDIKASPEGVAGKVVGVQISTTHASYADKHFSGSVDSIKPYQSADERNQDLVSGRIDAMIGDSLAISKFLAGESGQCCEIKGEVTDLAVYGPGIGVGLRKEDTELRDKINTAIEKIRADGTYEAISENYFDFDIFGE
ncbi:transporter substrate-binding domain-containing protein [Ruegeria hyattellae]|uniref:transporter substrate-binding domain-containing protein n=1 Tax=Ruegeria hyattellae TaxID=3233337 RepID=UPI002615464E|nr:transporter substrate-binding domain-containing protein [uncultured Ruegeria sp.]